MRSIFGREPSLIIGAVEALVALAAAIFTHWTGDTIGTVNAVVSLVLTAYAAWGWCSR
jgi:hypothetical protein